MLPPPAHSAFKLAPLVQRLIGPFLAGILSLVFLPSVGLGTSANYQSVSWRTEHGLPSNKIMSVAQSEDGYIWIATYEGLVRFDGVRFTRFDGTTIPEWKDSSITAFYAARDGTLWIGHTNGDLSSYRRGRFELHPCLAAWRGSKVQNIAEDEVGDIWIQDDTGVLIRVSDGRVLTPPSGQAPGLFEVACSEKAGLWVMCQGRLSRIRGGGLHEVQLAAEMDSYVHGLCASADGGLWVLANGELWKHKEDGWKRMPGTLQILGTPVQGMHELRDGRLVGGTSDHGAILLYPDDRSRDEQLWRATGFPSDWVTSAAEDHEGGIWIATGNSGLLRLRDRTVTTLVAPDAWQGRAVLSVCPSGTGFWVGTEGAGLYRLRDGVWTNYAKDAGIRNPYIWSVVEQGGATWLGTWGGGIYESRDERFARAPNLESLTAPVTALLPARGGGLWVGCTRGVFRYENGQLDWLEPADDRRLSNARTLLEEPDGTIWVGTNGNGLGRFRNGVRRQFLRSDGLPSHFITALMREADGTLWIGTRGSGLTRWKRERFVTIGMDQGLSDGTICHIEDDGNGYFWISTLGGILRVSKTQLHACADGTRPSVECISYGLSDGLLTLAGSGALQASGCRTPDGKLVFATDRGLALVDPANVQTNPHAPPVEIESVRVDGRVVGTAPFGTRPISIRPGEHRIEIAYTGLSFSAPEKVRFKRKLDGLETTWAEIGGERVSIYNYVPPGNYVFRVTAANSDNVWNTEGRSLALIIEPYFWQTLWFRLAAVAGLVGATGASAWYVSRRKLQRRLERLERERAIEAERTRIANDMHDDLGAHLTRITMLSGAARAEIDDREAVRTSLERIYQTARSVTRAMDEIVWAVNPKHDTLESLVSYLQRFAQDFLASAGMRCRLDLPVEFPNWRPSSEVRHNLFLAFKEALNNAVRHSRADTVTIRLTLSPSGCKLTIIDNGQGLFSTRTAAEEGRIAAGNGLKSIGTRMERIHGRFSLQNGAQGGCEASLFVPSNAPGCSGQTG